MEVAIVKYNAGNIQSVMHALDRLGVSYQLTDDADALSKAAKVIFPGVGEASSAMDYLRARGLDKLLPSLTQPFLGICLGQQLMCKHSEEGDTTCLGIFDVPVKKFELQTQGLKVPHIGWNVTQAVLQSESQEVHPLWKGIEAGHHFYYVHSYYAALNEDAIATCQYGHPFAASIAKGNFMAAQFHPEKSAAVGQKLLANFLAL